MPNGSGWLCPSSKRSSWPEQKHVESSIAPFRSALRVGKCLQSVNAMRDEMRSFAAGLSAAHLEQMLAPYIADRQVEASRDGAERGISATMVPLRTQRKIPGRRPAVLPANPIFEIRESTIWRRRSSVFCCPAISSVAVAISNILEIQTIPRPLSESRITFAPHLLR